jgi:hypothetical protein
MDHKFDKEKFERLMKFALETAIGGRDKVTVDTDVDWDIQTGRLYFLYIFIRIDGSGDDFYSPKDVEFELNRIEDKIYRVVNNQKFIFNEFGEFGKQDETEIIANGPLLMKLNIDAEDFTSQWAVNVEFDFDSNV